MVCTAFNTKPNGKTMHFHPCSSLFRRPFAGRTFAATDIASKGGEFMSCKTSTRVSQVTGCLPLPVNHSWKISVFIRSASFKCLCHNLDLGSISVIQEECTKLDILGCYFHRNIDHPSISACELQEIW